MSNSGNDVHGPGNGDKGQEQTQPELAPNTPSPSAAAKSVPGVSEKEDRARTAEAADDKTEHEGPKFPGWAIVLNLIFTGVVAFAAIVQAVITDSQLASMQEQNDTMIAQNVTMIDQAKAAWEQVDQTKDAIAEAKRANTLTIASGRATLAKMQVGLEIAQAANELAKTNASESLAKTVEAIDVAREANAAAKDTAQKSLDTASESNRIADRTAKEQLRAYISVPMNPRPLFQFIEGDRVFRLELRLKNAGQTPAKAVTVRVETYYRPRGEQVRVNTEKLEKLNGAGMTIGPGNDFPIFVTHPIGRADDAPVGQGWAWIVGRVDYVDAYDQKRFTNFCFYSGHPAVSRQGHEVIYGEHNNDSN